LEKIKSNHFVSLQEGIDAYICALIFCTLKTYFKHINEGIRTTLSGMKLTFKHLWDARRRRSHNNVAGSGYFNEQNGMVTLQYPFETMPIPDNGRYRLHNEMDDCIVCDKCAKVCPVDCIDIEPIKATGEVGKASDGSPIRLYAAKFDIDMAKCCYCGLCTTVCPTECLTMTKTFDYSEFDVRDMNYHYANLTPEQAEEKKALYEQFVREKEELKRSQQSASESIADSSEPIGKAKPVFAPKKPVLALPASEPIADSSEPITEEKSNQQKAPIGGQGAKPKPVFVPKKPLPAPPASEPIADSSEPITEEKSNQQKAPIGGQGAKPKPVFAPKKPLSAPPASEPIADSSEPIAKPKPVFVPKKPVPSPPSSEPIADSSEPITEEKSNQPNAPIGGQGAVQKENTDSSEEKPRPKPVFKPTMRPKKEE
jgi:formate hydrogenlyase subunit 6/NADH:ubiquinone oxidoreductase subunit I